MYFPTIFPALSNNSFSFLEDTCWSASNNNITECFYTRSADVRFLDDDLFILFSVDARCIDNSGQQTKRNGGAVC